MSGGLSIVPEQLNICGCVVTYHPEPRFPENFTGLMSEVPKWLIIDNRSSDGERRRLRSFTSASVELIENTENVGVASALNQAARRARELGFEWLLTFDQDSHPSADFLAKLISAYRGTPERDRIGMIGSNFLMEGTGLPFYPSESTDAATVEQASLITSGSMLSLKAFASVGPFRDDLFVDGVDSEFCLRLRRHGFKVVATITPAMRHNFGELRIHPLLWKRPRITHHSALRRYYMTRNGLVIAREYWHADRRWVMLSLKVLAAGFLGAMLFERHKIKKLGATLLGVIDAIRGRMGRVDVRWLRS